MMTREDWLEQRRACIGSSDMPIIALGENYGKDLTWLFMSKKGLIPHEEMTGDDIERGNTYEPIALQKIAERWGGTVHAAADDADKWERFYKRVEGRPLHGNFDGTWIDSQGRAWVLEVKAPRQWRANKMRAEGPDDAWKVQAHFLAGIADLCGAPGIEPGNVHGVIVAVYESDTTQVQRWEYELNSAAREWIQELFARAEKFWEDHIVADVPPQRAYETILIPKVEKTAKSEYETVEGEGWDKAARAYELAYNRHKSAEADKLRARNLLEQAMGMAEMQKVQVGNLRFANSYVDGRVQFDEKLMRAEHPEIDFTRYEKRGRGSTRFLCYGMDKTDDAEELREAIRTWPAQAIALGDDAPAAFVELEDRVKRHVNAINAEEDDLWIALKDAKGRTL